VDEKTIILGVLGLCGATLILAPLFTVWRTRAAGRMPVDLLEEMERSEALPPDEGFRLRWRACCAWLERTAHEKAPAVRAQQALTALAKLSGEAPPGTLDVDGARGALGTAARELVASARAMGGAFKRDPGGRDRVRSLAGELRAMLKG
jgi:hypothetical protein